MRDSHTTLRIKKLFAKGRTNEQIAQSIGRPNDLERVRKVTSQLTPPCNRDDLRALNTDTGEWESLDEETVICTADVNNIEVDDGEHT